MNISFADALFVVSGLLVFGGAIIIFGVAIYLGYTKGEVLSEHFKNSSSLITVPARIDKGLRGKTRLVYSVSSVVTFPRFFLKHGIVSAEDIENFPRDLRRKLVVLQWSLLTALTGIVTLGLIAMWK
ncbi:hypothetical protein IMF27_01075 [Pseudomonas sp. PCH199]|uniref:hypothetical protein n=1 Tax=unclassified Pseudomonas TaxID=196821 RepID=UPI000BC85E77|nr:MULTISPECIES: hypothetical protein [unclassified Pseudomonas]MCW8274449.1 hypothetical protein [Pseudomonas sp. PCH199]PAM85124.1 hypothetical protein CES87_01095 [Pseudomonas sp. ERMR1:02]